MLVVGAGWDGGSVEIVEKLLGKGDAVAIVVDVRSEKSDAKMGNVEVGARGRCGELGTSFATVLGGPVSLSNISLHDCSKIYKVIPNRSRTSCNSIHAARKPSGVDVSKRFASACIMTTQPTKVGSIDCVWCRKQELS